MSHRASSTGRLKGVYRRGKKFWYRYSHEGRQYRVPLETEDEGEAVTKALRILRDPVLAGADPLAEELDAFLADMRAIGTYTRSTAENRRAVLKKWTTERRLKGVRQITEDAIRSWLGSLRQGADRLEQSTVDSYGMMIRAFCVWLVEKKKLRENPAEFLKSKAFLSAKKRRFCRREQVDRLISECPSKDLKFILFAGFHAGMRKEEIIQARPEWFDFREKFIEIVESEDWKPKDKDKRAIPLSRQFRNFLLNEMRIDGELPGPFVLRPEVKQGKSRYRYDFRRPFEEYVTSKKLKWLKPHIMRHTFASLLAIAGVSIFKIAKWLGDDVKVVERHYAHLLPQDADIERAFGGKLDRSSKSGIDEAF